MARVPKENRLLCGLMADKGGTTANRLDCPWRINYCVEWWPTNKWYHGRRNYFLRHPLQAHAFHGGLDKYHPSCVSLGIVVQTKWCVETVGCCYCNSIETVSIITLAQWWWWHCTLLHTISLLWYCVGCAKHRWINCLSKAIRLMFQPSRGYGASLGETLCFINNLTLRLKNWRVFTFGVLGAS